VLSNTYIRKYIKDGLQSNWFYLFLTLTRSSRIKHLSDSHLIEWNDTISSFNYFPDITNAQIMFKVSQFHMFSYNLLTFRLPTLSQLKQIRPDIYKDLFTCPGCQSPEEDYYHIFECLVQTGPVNNLS
jgi:hypothetical protein